MSNKGKKGSGSSFPKGTPCASGAVYDLLSLFSSGAKASVNAGGNGGGGGGGGTSGASAGGVKQSAARAAKSSTQGGASGGMKQSDSAGTHQSASRGTATAADDDAELTARIFKALKALGPSATREQISEVVDRWREELEAQRAESAKRERIEREIAKRKAEELEAQEREAQRQRLEREAEEREAEELRNRLHAEQVTSMELPLDWENAFFGDTRTEGVHADSISDALIMSLSNLGKVDIEYMSCITGESCAEVIRTLRGSIYQNPESWEECFYRGWETAEEYLSGNLIHKWNAAKLADKKYNGYFADNLRAIERVMPKPTLSSDIYVTLGSPWVPTDIIDDFISHILNYKGSVYHGVKHDEFTGSWEVPFKSEYRYRSMVATTRTYGTPKMDALTILERTLNMQSVAVTEETDSKITKSGKKRVINRQETAAVLDKQDKMIAEFRSWVWKSKERSERLVEIFEGKFGCLRGRVFDGSFLTFPTMSESVTLYPYQKNAVARIIFSKNTLLAHDVGSGKTYIMVAAGMELMRMGLSRKNMYVVPNNLLGQWRDIFLSLYPKARLLVVEPKHFTKDKKQQTLSQMRDGSFDAIIIAYSCFERIAVSKQFQMNELQRIKDTLLEICEDGKRRTPKIKSRLNSVTKQLAELAVSADVLSEICFDELGVTRLFVDEAHNYKNLPIDTQSSGVLGISSQGSKKCADMLDKIRHVQSADHGGVVLATGTPITNSVTDAFVIQTYLQPGELKLLDLSSFDSWIGMFAEKRTEFEIDVDTSSYRLATRFSRFHNLPELTSLLSAVADFHRVDKTSGVPEVNGRHDCLVQRSKGFSDYLKIISERAEQVRRGQIRRTDDNMLKITTDGRKAALDLRLVVDSASSHGAKVMRCAENVYDIYVKSAPMRSAQIIFCDSSTPKSDFNIYDEMKRTLVAMGASESEIAFVHDATTERKRESLFQKVRRGDIRILIGSTFKLGLGVNVQDKLIALHHLDIPWRPADMTQREGRIIRQGNENDVVFIYRYITEGSFDAYSWQLLETKERFICDLLSGSLNDRCAEDIEDVVLDYASVKALAVGNPLVKQRVELANELARYRALQRRALDTRIALEQELESLPAQIEHQSQIVERCRADLDFISASKNEYTKEQRRQLREQIFDAVMNNELVAEQRAIGEYRGFEIVLPANMIKEQPFIWLCREGKYYVELGDSEVGVVVRMDNLLDELDRHLAKLSDGLAVLNKRREDIEAELSREESYAEQIKSCTERLREIDNKLGVEIA